MTTKDFAQAQKLLEHIRELNALEDELKFLRQSSRKLWIHAGESHAEVMQVPLELWTPLLDILDKYKVKATFFVIYHKGFEKEYKAIVDRGHTIALHSYTHDYSKIYKSQKGYYSDLNKIHDYVKKTTGVDSRIIRFPGGSSNTVSNKYNKGIMKKLKASVTKNGYYYHDWNVDSTDAAGRNRKASVLLSNVKKGAGKKKVINVLMHDTGKSKKTTVEALPSIIEYLRKQGYSFEAITEDSVLIQHGK